MDSWHVPTDMPEKYSKKLPHFLLTHSEVKARRRWAEKLNTAVEKDRWKLCLAWTEG